MSKMPFAVAIAWLSAGLIVGCYVILRFAVATDSAVAISQFLYLGGPLLAATFAGAAAWVAPAETLARRIWFYISAAMALLLVSESVYSWQAVVGGVADLGLGVADLLNVSALVLIMIMMSSTIAVKRKGRRWIALMIANTLVIMTSVFTALYGAWISRLIPSLDLLSVVTMTAYSLMGIMLFVFNVFVWLDMGAIRENASSRLVAVSIGIYACGLILWPLWRVSSAGHDSALWAEVLVNVLFLAGYLIMFLSGVYRIEDGSLPWHNAPPKVRRPTTPYVDMMVSALATGAVLASGYGAFASTPGSADRRVYVAILFVSAAFMVLRTTLLAYHDTRLNTRLTTDRITGAHSPRDLASRLSEYVASASRFGESFVLALVHLEPLPVRGAPTRDSVGGGETLARVAGSLRGEFERTGHVFRLPGDDFAVIAQLPDSHNASDTAERVRWVVRQTDVEGGGLECSVGWAQCPDDAIGYDALMAKGSRALSWAVAHGGGRVVHHRDAVDRDSVTGEQIEALPGSRLAMTRALSAAADARDPSNIAHSRNVAEMVRLFAERLEFKAAHVERVQIAGLLHDVGKLALPAERMPVRSSRATRQARRKEHCTLGSRMLESLALEGVPLWVLHHHERWDGTGYPSGLAAHEIPFEARMISLANHYDSRVSGAHYGAPMSKHAALQEIDLGMGVRFDPELAEEFIALISSSDQFNPSGRSAV